MAAECTRRALTREVDSLVLSRRPEDRPRSSRAACHRGAGGDCVTSSRPSLRAVWLAGVASLCLISGATAQTLEECLAIARSHAPSIRVADADVSRADEAIREARAALSPTL